MRRLIVLLIVLMPSVSWAMEKFVDFVQDDRGNIITGVSVTVYTHGTTNKATIYSDNGLTLKSNPFNNATDGTVQFYAANGRYDLVYSKVGVSFTSSNTTDRVLFDSVDFAGGGGGGVGIGNAVTSGSPSSFLYVAAGPVLAQASLTGLVLGNGASAPTAYTGTTCTNQVVRVLSAAGAATCVTITSAYVDSTILTTAATVTFAQGGTGLSSALDDTVMVSSGTAWVAKLLADCQDSGGNHLNYTQSTNSFSCGTSGGITIGNTVTSGVTQNMLYVDSAGKLAQLSLGTGQVPTLIAGALVAGTINAADPQLDNLSSVAINTALLPGTAGTIDLGSAAKPFEFLWLSGTSGTPGTNNFKLTGAATAARTITLPDASLTVAGINVSNSWSAGVKQTFAPNATNSGLNIGSVSGDPASPANGDMWYDSTGNKFRCRENGSSANCIGSGSSVTLRDQLQNTTGTTYDWVPYDGCNGTTCTSSIYFNDEFCGNNPSTSAVSNGNLSWSAWDGVGTGSSAKGASTFPNVCFISLTSGATAGNFTGISLNDVATNGYGGLGDLHGNLNWELHWIFKFSSATTPAYYLGVASNPQSALIPTDWMGLQFDTSNSDTTNMTFVCKKGATVVRTDTTIAADTTFHHLRMWSTATNAINFELYDATGAIQKQSLAVCGSTSIPTSSMIPFAQAGTQAAAARTLSIDRFSYKMRGVSR